MASAKFQLSPDGGLSWLATDVPLASGEGIAQGAGNASVYARLASTAGVDTVAWSVVAASENAPLLTLTQYPDKSIRTLVPKDSAATYLLRCVVNGGIDSISKRPSPDLTSALAIKVLTTGGAELLAPGEGDEGDRAFGWTTAFNLLALAGIGAGTATRVRANASSFLSGDVTFAQGTNVTIAQVGSTITINASGGGGGALPSPYTATLATVDSRADSLQITAPTVTGADAPNIRIKGVGAHELSADDLFGGDVIIEGGDSDTTDGGAPGNAILLGGTGSFGGGARVLGGSSAGGGGNTFIMGGSGTGGGANGGPVEVGGGTGNAGGGSVSVYGGSGGVDGGSASLGGGTGTSGFGGNVNVTGGTGTTTGGEVLLTPGLGASSVSARTRVTRGAFTVEESTATGRQINETAVVTTATTTPTLIYSYQLADDEAASFTVLAICDRDGGTAEVVKKAVFRCIGGSAAQTAGGSTFDASVPGFVLGQDVTISRSGTVVQVNVVASTSGTAYWTAGIAIVSYVGTMSMGS